MATPPNIDDYLAGRSSQGTKPNINHFTRSPAEQARLAREEAARKRAASAAAKPVKVDTSKARTPAGASLNPQSNINFWNSQAKANPNGGKQFDLWGTIGKGFGDAAKGFGSLFGPAFTGSFGKAGEGTFGKQDNSLVVPKKKAGNSSLPGKGSNWDGGDDMGWGAGDPGGGEGQSEFDLMSFADALAQAQGLLSGMGVGSSVSYDPLRNQARSQWADADARTLAMAQELQKTIGAQGAALGQTYDTSLADTNKATQFANNQNLQSAEGMKSMLSQQAQALGIEEAVANSVNGGNYAARDTTDRAADTAARGQITSNQLIGNKASALDFNSDLVGAAGLSGQQARLARQNELSRLLAGYDVQEQEANAASQNDFLSQALGLAGQLQGTNRDDYKQWNDNQRFAMSEANDYSYDQGRLAQSNAVKPSNKPALMNEKDSITRALSDLGKTEKDLLGGDREKIMTLARMYQGYTK